MDDPELQRDLAEFVAEYCRGPERITVTGFAKLCFMSRSTVHRIIRTGRTWPSRARHIRETMKRVARRVDKIRLENARAREVFGGLLD